MLSGGVDEWEMAEHFGGGSHKPHGGRDQLRETLNSDEYQRAIIESMKNARTGDITTEDELLARAMEESIRQAN